MTVLQICFIWPVTCFSRITWSPSFLGDIQILTGNNTFWNSVFDPLFLYLSWLPSLYCPTVFSFSFKIVSSMGESLCLCNYYLHFLGQNCYLVQFSSIQFSHSVVSDTLWPHGLQHASFPVHHQVLELAQIHIHRGGDAVQPSHPPSSPSPPVFKLSQHQVFFHWVSSLHHVAQVLEFQLQHQSFQWIFRTDFLYDWLVLSPCSPRDSQESSPIP